MKLYFLQKINYLRIPWLSCTYYTISKTSRLIVLWIQNLLKLIAELCRMKWTAAGYAFKPHSYLYGECKFFIIYIKIFSPWRHVSRFVWDQISVHMNGFTFSRQLSFIVYIYILYIPSVYENVWMNKMTEYFIFTIGICS